MPRREVAVLELHGHRARAELVSAHVRGHRGRQCAQHAADRRRLLHVPVECRLATDLLRGRPSFDRRHVDPAHTPPEPLRRPSPDPARERCALVRQHVDHALHAECRELRLQLGPDARQFGEAELLHERSLAACFDHAHPGRAGARAWLGPFGRELGDELGAAAADRDPHPGLALHRVADPARGRLECLASVERLCAREVEIPLVDARALDQRRVAGEDRSDRF